MSARLITNTAARVTTTPNAVMTTLASPTQGNTSTSMWRVEMASGQTGPDHSFDVAQTWHLTSGAARITVAERSFDLTAGDTLVVPPDLRRQISTDGGATFIVAGDASGLATPHHGDGVADPVAPPWIV